MVIIWLMMVNHVIWLVVEPYPSEKWWSESQLGWCSSQLNGQSWNSMVPNHQKSWSDWSISGPWHSMYPEFVAGFPRPRQGWHGTNPGRCWPQLVSPEKSERFRYRKSMGNPKNFGCKPFTEPQVSSHRWSFLSVFFSCRKTNRVCMPQNTSLLAFSSRSPERGGTVCGLKTWALCERDVNGVCQYLGSETPRESTVTFGTRFQRQIQSSTLDLAGKSPS